MATAKDRVKVLLEDWFSIQNLVQNYCLKLIILWIEGRTELVPLNPSPPGPLERVCPNKAGVFAALGGPCSF